MLCIGGVVARLLLVLFFCVVVVEIFAYQPGRAGNGIGAWTATIVARCAFFGYGSVALLSQTQKDATNYAAVLLTEFFGELLYTGVYLGTYLAVGI